MLLDAHQQPYIILIKQLKTDAAYNTEYFLNSLQCAITFDRIRNPDLPELFYVQM